MPPCPLQSSASRKEKVFFRKVADRFVGPTLLNLAKDTSHVGVTGVCCKKERLVYLGFNKDGSLDETSFQMLESLLTFLRPHKCDYRFGEVGKRGGTLCE